MQKRLKLAFDELEKELTIITQTELAQLMGGNGSSSSSGLTAESSIHDVVNYFTAMGFEFTQDSSGNYFLDGNVKVKNPNEVGFHSGYSWEDSGGSGDEYWSTGFNGYELGYVNYFESYGYYLPGQQGSNNGSSGSAGSPLPNGDCLFNMVAYILDGHANDAQCYKDELMNQYAFTQTTLTNGLPGYSYDPDNVASYIASYRSEYTVSYGELPNASNIQSVLNMDGGKVGASYNGHNYVIETVLGNGKVKMYDPTNSTTKTVNASELTGVYNFYKN